MKKPKGWRKFDALARKLAGIDKDAVDAKRKKKRRKRKKK
jgi:hypothetical protein